MLLCAVSLGPNIPLSILFSDTVGLCDSCNVKGKFSCLLKQHVIMVTDVLVYKALCSYIFMFFTVWVASRPY